MKITQPNKFRYYSLATTQISGDKSDENQKDLLFSTRVVKNKLFFLIIECDSSVEYRE